WPNVILIPPSSAPFPAPRTPRRTRRASPPPASARPHGPLWTVAPTIPCPRGLSVLNPRQKSSPIRGMWDGQGHATSEVACAPNPFGSVENSGRSSVYAYVEPTATL